MVGEHVGQVFRPLARLPLDPGGGRPVAGGASGARDLPVADVSHEHMPEAVLMFALHRGGAGGTHEVLPRELVQRLLDLCQVPLSHFSERAGPEDLAQHRRVLEQALAVGAQRVEAGGDQRLHGVRHLLDRRRLSSVREQAHELLGVEGVSARALEQFPLRLGRQHRPLEQRGDEAGGLALAQRSEVDALRISRVRPEARMPLVQLRAGGAEENQRHTFRPVRKVLEEGEERLVCPMQVLEDEHRLPPLRPRLEHTPPGRERLLQRGRLAPRADERSETGLEPGEVRVGCGQRLLELGLRLLLRVGLEDPALRLDDLAERPEGDPVPVGKAAPLAPAGETRSIFEVVEELGAEAALPHARLADDRHQLAGALLRRPLERADQERLLELTPDEWRGVGAGDV